MKRIIFTVTNDLTYDQRMNRICGSLAKAGYEVALVGRKRKNSLPLRDSGFEQIRLPCWFDKGFLFYAEYNLRLFFLLLFAKTDAVCAIDLDTVIPCILATEIRKKKRIYDAHELFTEMKEVRTRPRVYRFWKRIEKWAVPKFHYCYTVGESIANIFKDEYNREFEVIRNMPLPRAITVTAKKERFILYQGAVNEGRGFEFIIPAMKRISVPLVICGDGNYMPQLKELIRSHGVEDKIVLKGMLLPSELWQITQEAYIGINFTEKEGLNNYLCLPNKFFDYIQADLPQVTNNYPEYRKINSEYHVALLIDEMSQECIAEAVNKLIDDSSLYEQLASNAAKARSVLHWDNEELKLLSFYNKVFSDKP